MESFRQESQANVILRKRTDRDYLFLAEQGSVEDGMRPQEVYLALGFPDRVERRTLGQQEFDQWIYGTKYYYFYAGILVKAP
jgi:hypothetical protein